jgi:DNA-binding response OmpR family regulator
MSRSDFPSIALVTDDDADEGHALHVLAKYHFSNSLRKVRQAGDALRHFDAWSGAPYREIPELIILSFGHPAQLEMALASRRGNLEQVPLVVLAETREAEDAVRALSLPRTYCMGKPLGFFKLLEAMQKLGMYWMVLKSPPDSP